MEQPADNETAPAEEPQAPAAMSKRQMKRLQKMERFARCRHRATCPFLFAAAAASAAAVRCVTFLSAVARRCCRQEENKKAKRAAEKEQKQKALEHKRAEIGKMLDSMTEEEREQWHQQQKVRMHGYVSSIGGKVLYQIYSRAQLYGECMCYQGQRCYHCCISQQQSGSISSNERLKGPCTFCNPRCFCDAPLQEKKQQVMAARQATKAHNQQVRCKLRRSLFLSLIIFSSPLLLVVKGTANPFKMSCCNTCYVMVVSSFSTKSLPAGLSLLTMWHYVVLRRLCQRHRRW
jgi:hypothetical protein